MVSFSNRVTVRGFGPFVAKSANGLQALSLNPSRGSIKRKNDAIPLVSVIFEFKMTRLGEGIDGDIRQGMEGQCKDLC